MKLLLIFVLIQTSVVSLFGQTMDVGTHDVLIQKLEKGLEINKDIQIQLRLADLYADRSRLKTIQETEEKCQQCHSSNQDRRKSLSLYLDIFDKVTDEEQKRVFEQIAQSHTLLGETTKAKSFYKKIIDKKYDKGLKAIAHQKQADLYFFSHDYSRALKDYKKSNSLDPSLKTALVSYRMAWCDFNSGQYALAKNHLDQLLSSQDEMDSSLRVDIARDFAKFTAKGTIDNKSIKRVHQLSDKSEAKDNVELLASELDRLGRPTENLIVNHYLLEAFETDPADKALAYMRMSQAELSLKRYASVTASFQKSTEFYKKINCENLKDRCADYQSKAQKFLIFWNRIEKDKPSSQLHQVWTTYLELFRDDFDMHFIAAQSFHKGSKMGLAQHHYLVTAELVHQDEKPESRKLLAVSLDAAMACAEESKVNSQKKLAYQSYLKFNPKGEKQLQAKYQLAYIEYDDKNYEAALVGFNKIITEHKESQKKLNIGTALKSAHLVLDIHAINKNNSQVMDYAQSFAQSFPKNKSEFDSIYRKALLNESLASLKKSPADLKYQDKLSQKLKVLNLSSVNQQEKALILETRVQLSRSTRNLEDMKSSSLALIGMKGLKESIKNFAYDQIIWASEMKLDFKKAYEYSLIRFQKMNRGKNEQIRLGVLAELSSKNSKLHYDEALKKTRGTLESNQLRAKIVQNSSAPWAELISRLKQLKSSPQLLSELALVTYSRYPNKQKAELVLKERSVAIKPAGIQLRRHLEIPKLKSLSSQVSKHIISHRSESQAQKGITKRLELISQLEVFANSAIERKDLVLQTVTLEVIKNEKLRFARDLTTLPLPKGLSKNDQIQYLKILETKVATIEKEAKSISQRIEGVWKTGTLMKSLHNNYESSDQNLKRLLALEIDLILPHAPESQKNQLKTWKEYQRPDARELLAAREKLKAYPFDEASLRQLIASEKNHDHLTHVAYLEQRLIDLQKRMTP